MADRLHRRQRPELVRRLYIAVVILVALYMLVSLIFGFPVLRIFAHVP
jgi:hypothetical protein